MQGRKKVLHSSEGSSPCLSKSIVDKELGEIQGLLSGNECSVKTSSLFNNKSCYIGDQCAFDGISLPLRE